jgi:polyisoprenoid-binding protein YceI
LKLSPDNAEVEFVGAKAIGSHDGAFQRFSGTVDFRNGDPATAEIKVEIDLASVKTDNEKLDGHLKSPDFFDVEKYPKATFQSKGVTPGGADGATHTVAGNLTLHGVEKAVSFPAKIAVSGDEVSVKSEFKINRKDFGIVYPGMPDNLIKDDVVIRLSVDSALE